MSKVIVNCETGEAVETELTAEDLAQQEIDEKAKKERDAKVAAQIAARQAILDRLGLSEEEAKLLLG